MNDLRKWSPVGSFLKDFNELAKFLDFSNIPAVLKGGEPRIDIIQNENEVIIKADIPGVRKEDLSLTVEDNVVTIHGEANTEDHIEKDCFIHSERYYGSFSRTIPLPTTVKSDDATAIFVDGVLTVTIPKASRPEKGYKIAIK